MKYVTLALCALMATQSLEAHRTLHRHYSDRRLRHLSNEQKRNFFTDLYHDLKDGLREFKDDLLSIPDSLTPDHPYEYETAWVRYSPHDEINLYEKEFVNHRTPYVHHALQQFLGEQFDQEHTPTIALCCSGGGFRAMVSTLGFLQGLDEVGLLNGTMYMCGLSGSTWAMAPWIASKKALNQHVNTLKYQLDEGLEIITDLDHLNTLFKTGLAKIMYGQFPSAMDIYGPLLANILLTADFGDDAMGVTLSGTHTDFEYGVQPLPIYTAITTNLEPYEWYEFTPFEMGSSYNKAYIPIWSFGRKYKNGVTANDSAELSLGYMMGIFGSAFTLDLEDVIRHTEDKLQGLRDFLPDFFERPLAGFVNVLAETILDEVRLFPAIQRNPVYKMDNTLLSDHKTLSLVDAGIDFNLPFPPLLREDRHIDIIIVYDASSDIGEQAPNLVRAADYCARKGLAFPEIDVTDVDNHVVSVYQHSTDPTAPIVVYFPLRKNENYDPDFDPKECCDDSYCSTFNFTYEPEEVEELAGLAHFCVAEQADVLREVIRSVALR